MKGGNFDYPVHVLFLKPRDDGEGGEHWLNRVTASIGCKIHGKGFCHVELCIPDIDAFSSFGRPPNSPPSYISSSIYNGEHVRVTSTKTFANPGYVVHTLSMSQGQVKRMLDFVYECQRREVGFDRLGMYFATLPFQIKPGDSNKTFCSKFVLDALQAAGGLGEAVERLNPNIVTPSRLYKVLTTVETTQKPGNAGSKGRGVYRGMQDGYCDNIDNNRSMGAASPGCYAELGSSNSVPGVVGTVDFKLNQLKKFADTKTFFYYPKAESLGRSEPS